AGAIALLLTWSLLRNAEFLIRLMGKNIIEVVSRIIGLLIGALAVEFIMDGVLELIKSGAGVI
ncbi:hypothetical protein DRN72_03900, partial [Methanosarcinales archaeon]